MLGWDGKRPREERAFSAHAPDKRARQSAAPGRVPAATAVPTPQPHWASLFAATPSFASAPLLGGSSPAYGGSRSYARGVAQPQPTPQRVHLWPAYAYADGYVSCTPKLPHAPMERTLSSAFATRSKAQWRPLPAATQAQPPEQPFAAPPASVAADGFGGSYRAVQFVAAPRLGFDAGLEALVKLLRTRRPDAAPPMPAARSLSAAPSRDALQQNELAQLDVRRLEATRHAKELDYGEGARSLMQKANSAQDVSGSEQSRQREIEQATQKCKELSLQRQCRQAAPPAPVDTGLVDLTDVQKELVSSSLAPGAPHDKLASGSFRGFGELDVTRQNFECMREGKWLNDEVINFYLALLQERELSQNAKQPRVHFHSTFFYNKLYADNSQYSFKAVQRWTTAKRLGYSILDCDLVIVPVHQDVHWVLAVIDMKGRSIRYYDSLGGVDHTCMANLARYIADESQHKLEKALDAAEWPRSAPTNIPEQKNGCDCGVFMVKYADWLARQAPFSFEQGNMPYFRKRIVAEIRQKAAK